MRWQRAIEPAAGERFAASLGLGTGARAGLRRDGAALLAATRAVRARRLRPVGASSPDGSHVLFAGTIDNARAIARALGCDADDPAAIYAQGLAAWGDAVDLRLAGRFAAIVWHEERGSLRLACSPVVAPPLHWWHGAGAFAAASTPRALFATGDVPRRLDEWKLADSLILNGAEIERGWFADVSRLAPGRRLEVSAGRPPTIRVFHDLSALPPVRLPRDEDYVAAADTLFTEAVGAALEGARRPALALSGGLDSQAVAVYAVAARPDRPLHAYTGVPEPGWDGLDAPGRLGDERAHVAALAARYPQIVPHAVNAAGAAWDTRLGDTFLLGSLLPRNAAGPAWMHPLAATAAQAGADVMLTGSLGNATIGFGGEGALPGWLQSGAWDTLAAELWHAGAPLGLPRRLIRDALLPLLPRGVRRAILVARGRLPPGRLRAWSPATPAYAEVMALFARADAAGFASDFDPPSDTRASRIAAIGAMQAEQADLMLALELMHGMAWRDPTAHRPLVEFCLAIPDRQFRNHGRERWLLQGRVPPAVLAETRRGDQDADWRRRLLRQRPAMLDELDDLLGDADLTERLDLAGLRRALAEWGGGPVAPAHGQRLRLALPRALAAARFIRFVGGAN